MNLAILDSSTGTVHLFHTRGRNTEAAIKRYCLENLDTTWSDCDWMQFNAVQCDLGWALVRAKSGVSLRRKRTPKVIIDVKGGVAELRREVPGVEVQIVDHDQP